MTRNVEICIIWIVRLNGYPKRSRTWLEKVDQL
nr:MAG TPA_asm: hypothetical protein [Caudoviricetes sp.]